MSFLRVAFVAFLFAVCFGQTFVDEATFINTIVCKGNTTCIAAQPDPVPDVTAVAGVKTWYFDFSDNPTNTITACPTGKYINLKYDGTMEFCSSYNNKVASSICRSVSYPPCNGAGGLSIIPCCK